MIAILDRKEWDALATGKYKALFVLNRFSTIQRRNLTRNVNGQCHSQGGLYHLECSIYNLYGGVIVCSVPPPPHPPPEHYSALNNVPPRARMRTVICGDLGTSR